MLRSSTRASLSLIVLAAVAALAACSKKEGTPPPAAAAAPEAANAPVAESAPAPKVENVKEFKIGDLPAVALRDGGMTLPNDNKVFGVGHTPEDVAAVLKGAGLPTNELQLSIQPLLVKTTDHVLLFDTGAGSNFGPGAGHLPESLAAAGIDATSVTDIFISHAHGDHVGGLVDAKGALNFPNATIHISKPEWAYLSGLNADTAKQIGVEQFAALIAGITPKVVAFAPGAEIISGTVKAIEIKGHTPGHSGYLITSGSASLLYVGDSMHHSVVSVQKPDWPMNYDGDKTVGAASRVKLVNNSASSAQRIYAVHFPFPGIGIIEKRGDGNVWVPE